MPALDYTQQTVLITGASSGIGASFARALAARGADLVLVARRRDRLDALASELMSAHGVTVTAITQDLGAVDISAPVQIRSAFLPEMVKTGKGFLINVASMAAYTFTPRMAVYGAAKAFVLSFTESLWAETRTSGVTVFALSPGATSTEFNAVVGTDDATAGARMRTPDDVVATALAHLDRRNPGPSVIDGSSNRAAAVIGRVVNRRATASLMHRLTDPARRR